MNSIEEQILAYIDGDLSAEEQQIIEGKIAHDIAYATVYTELLELHQSLANLDFEEPSMSFTRNVMEGIKLEMAPVALKTRVDTRIIYGLTAVFITAIIVVATYAISMSNINLTGVKMPAFNFSLQADLLINPLVIQLFIFVDVMLALLYFDRFLRRKKV
jgi:anti-sigma factor RsiW